MLALVTLPANFAGAAFLGGVAGMLLTAWLAPRRWSVSSILLWAGFLLLLAGSVTALGDSGPLDDRSAGVLTFVSLLTIAAGAIACVVELRGRDRTARAVATGTEGVRREVERLGTTNQRLEEENRELRRKVRAGEDHATGANALLESTLVRHRRAAETASAQARKHRSVFDGALEGMALLERETLRLADVNASLVRMTGWDATELAQRTVMDLFAGSKERPGKSDLQRIAREKRPLAVSLALKQGGELPVEITVGIVGEGESAQLLAVVRDASVRVGVERDHEEAMRTATERLAHAEQTALALAADLRAHDEHGRRLTELSDRKDRYLSSVSHELRTPLASIRSFSEILLKHGESDPAVRREFLEIIQKESERLTRLVNDTLDLARIEAGAAKLLLSEFDARAVVHDAVQSMQGFAAERGVGVIEIPSGGDRPLRADRDRVQQLLMNLIGNAVKFSPEGAEVDVGLEPGDREGRIVLVVRDRGRGIPPEDIERVFDRFHRCNDEPGSAGTGLGLAISREIVVLHGGRIWAESTPGRGATFRAEFPAPDEIRARMPRSAATTGPISLQITGPISPTSLPALVRAAAAEGAAAGAAGGAATAAAAGSAGGPGRRDDWSTTGTLPPLGPR